MDSSDSLSLKIIVYKPGERSALVTNRIAMEIPPIGARSSTRTQIQQKGPLSIFPLMNAKLRFQTPILCSNICNTITHKYEQIRTTKHSKLRWWAVQLSISCDRSKTCKIMIDQLDDLKWYQSSTSRLLASFQLSSLSVKLGIRQWGNWLCAFDLLVWLTLENNHILIRPSRERCWLIYVEFCPTHDDWVFIVTITVLSVHACAERNYSYINQRPYFMQESDSNGYKLDKPGSCWSEASWWVLEELNCGPGLDFDHMQIILKILNYEC